MARNEAGRMRALGWQVGWRGGVKVQATRRGVGMQGVGENFRIWGIDGGGRRGENEG